MVRTLALTTFLLTSFALTPALAADAAGAEQVKTMLQGLMDRYITKSEAEGRKITTNGTLQVTPQGSYYAITMPHVTITTPRNDSKVDFGVLKMNIMPTATSGEWKMTVALPTPIRFETTKPSPNRDTPPKKETLEIHNKTEKYLVTYNEPKQYAVSSEIVIKDVKFVSTRQPESITIASITGGHTTTLDAENRVSGQGQMMVNGFRAPYSKDNSCSKEKVDGQCPPGHKAKNDFLLTLDNLTFDLKFDQYDPAVEHKINQQMQELNQAGLDPEKINSPESMDAYMKILMDAKILDGFDFKTTIKNLKMFDGTNETAQPILSMADYTLGFGADDWRKDKSSGYLSFAAGPVDFNFPTTPSEAQKIEPFMKVMTPYIPTSQDMKLSYTNLPHVEMFKQFGNLAKAGVAGEGGQVDTQMMGMQAMMTLPQLLANAGTTVTLTSNSSAPKQITDIDGTFKAEPGAMYVGTGELKALFTGLDQMVVDFQTLAQNNPAEEIQSASKGLIGILTGMQMFGQQAQGPNGEPARSYHLVMDAAGKITLNGTDLSVLMQQFAPPTADPQPAIPDASTTP